MNTSTRCRRLFDITAVARACGLAAAAALLAAGAPSRAAAQSIDATLEQQIEDQVESDVTGAVEQQIEDQVESDVAGTVEQQVEDQVESDVAGAVEQQVEDQVESDVTGTIEDEVQQLVESDVAASVEEQVQGQVESDVASTVEQQVESGVVDTIERQVESRVTGALEDDAASSVASALERQIEAALGDRLGADLDDAVDQVRQIARDLGIEDIGAAVDEAIRRIGAAGQDGAAGEGADPGEAGPDAAATERFVRAVDDLGRAAESRVWVILVPNRHVARIQSWGFTVRERRDLNLLERVLLRVDAPEDRTIAQAALELALDAPGTSVDFNHVYGAEQAGDAGAAAAVAARIDTPRAAARAPVVIGIVDSAVVAEHEALAGADVTQQDFVPYSAPRPTAHGTAVASILVGESASVRGALAGARLHAASVFFEDEAGNEAATAASLVSALEWLASAGADVVNMSLSGPPNRVLEAAIEASTARGHVIVAAVGNNGPHGEPLYPAAYEPVIGITAVDASHRVYRYANRGRQVTFSAPGVDVAVALGDGGYAQRSGTSMAAPYAAAMIARSLAGLGEPADGVLARLKASALDLGDEDFDETYGFGLIAALE